MTHEKFIDAMLSFASGVQKYEKALAVLEERERKYRETLEAIARYTEEGHRLAGDETELIRDAAREALEAGESGSGA